MLVEEKGVTPSIASAIGRCEIEEEIRSVLPVGELLSLVRKMRQDGKHIAFVSDMYLPADVIQEMLRHVGVWEPQDRLYVSCAIGTRKSTGMLYKHLLDDLKIGPNQVIHVGDFLLSDFLVPRFKVGIKSFPARSARSNIYERFFGEPCRCLYCSSVAGASRAARVGRGGEKGTVVETSLYRLGCNVLGPILSGFLLWTLQKAAQAGIHRLYFLSRDGEVMLDFARELAGRLEIGIELRYLHVSRTAIFPALMGTGVDSHTIRWLKEDTIVLTLRILADRLKVDACNLQEGLSRAGVRIQGLYAPLNRSTLEKIYGLLVTDPILKEMIAESGLRAQQNLAGYLEQEMLFDGTPSALVDLGWHGGIQDVIFSCFNERLGYNGISGYYFGVDLPGEPANRKFGYFFNHLEGTKIHRFRHLFRVLIELLCSGSHGMVRFYRLDGDGTYSPVCGELEHPANWARINSIRQGVQAFVNHLDGPSMEGTDYEHIRPQILRVFKKLFFFPSKNEALALGGLRFSADQAGHGLHHVASPFTPASAIRFLTKRTYAGRSSISSWFFASWRCSGAGTRLLLSPLVVLLRLYFCGSDMLKFYKLIIIDTINNLIGANLALMPSKNSVKKNYDNF